jgi:2-methylaconitate cis-trans-isomerase PrpF
MPVQTYPIDIIASPENVLVEPRRMQLSAVLMRAGTSKGLFLNLADLPEDRSQWGAIILGAMGSPDPYLKQLDGMGGGVSTQSKVAVICPSARPDADVDYLFIQGQFGSLVCQVKLKHRGH